MASAEEIKIEDSIEDFQATILNFPPSVQAVIEKVCTNIILMFNLEKTYVCSVLT